MNGLGQLAGILPMLMQQGKIGGAGMGLLPMLMQKGQGQQGFNPMAMMQMFGQQQDQQPMAPPPMMPRPASGQIQPPMGMSSLPPGGMTPPFNPTAPIPSQEPMLPEAFRKTGNEVPLSGLFGNMQGMPQGGLDEMRKREMMRMMMMRGMR